MDLEQGAVDAIAMDVIVAGYQIQQRNADFVILEDASPPRSMALASRRATRSCATRFRTLEEMAATEP